MGEARDRRAADVSAVPPGRRSVRSFLARWSREVFTIIGEMIGFTVPQPVREDAKRVESARGRREKRFAPEVLALLGSAHSVEIETRRAPGAPPYRAPILMVVDDDGRVYSRCLGGTAGYWYRRILINPGVELHTEGGTVYARAVPAADERTVALVSELYRQKYGPDDPDTQRLLHEDVQIATVRFQPI